MKIEDHMIGLGNPIYATNPNIMQDNFYTNLLKNRISELEKQLAGKSAIIDFSLVQIISKFPDLQKNKRSDNGQFNNKSDYDGRHCKNVLTKTRNDLKPPETIWNHLKPTRNYQKLAIL